MKYLVYIIFSIIEYSSLFVLMLALFRFKIREYIKEIILASTTNAIIAFLLSYIGFIPVSLIGKIFVVILSLIFIFKEKLLKSLWMTVSGYALFIVIQTLFLKLLSYYNLFDLTDINPYSLNTHIQQLSTTLLLYIICFFIRKSNDGFGFSFHKKLFRASKKLYISISLIVVFLLCLMVYLSFEYKNSLYVSITLVVAIISLIILLWLSYTQEKKQFND
jgi:hypothetical protein